MAIGKKQSGMPREEAGQRSSEYGKDRLSEQAKKGAEATQREREKKVSQRGTKPRTEKFTKEELSEQARKGAQAIEKKRR